MYFTNINLVMDHKIKLKKREREYLKSFKQDGKKSLREINRANILLLLDRGKKTNDIMDFLNVDRTTIWRTQQKFLLSGIDKALTEKTRPGQPIKYTTRHEAELVALACSESPSGRKRWTLELLTETLRKQEGFESINHETVRLLLKKTNVNLG